MNAHIEVVNGSIKVVWNLWLDDERDPLAPTSSEYQMVSGRGACYCHEYVWAKSTNEAILLVEKLGIPEYMSLDHDLGGDDTTMKFIKLLAYSETPVEKIPEYQVHSANPVGTQNIISFMESWKKAFSDVS